MCISVEVLSQVLIDTVLAFAFNNLGYNHREGKTLNERFAT